MNLSSLSKIQLEESLRSSVRVEKKAIGDVLSHLLEMENRKIYFGKGYDSLFTYLTKEKLYSDSEACTRVSAMRLLKRAPKVIKKLENNSLTLTGMADLNRFINNENRGRESKVSTKEVNQLIDQVSDKTSRDAKNLLDDIAQVEPQFRMIKIKADKILNKKIDRVMRLMGNEMSMQNLFEHLIDQQIAELKKSNKPRKTNVHSRYISQSIKDHVSKRSQNRCEHLANGTRCIGAYILQ
jgi:hypothetical protein